MEMIQAVIARNEDAAAEASDKIMDYMEEFTRKVLDLG